MEVALAIILILIFVNTVMHLDILDALNSVSGGKNKK